MVFHGVALTRGTEMRPPSVSISKKIVARMGRIGNVYKILVKKPEEKRAIGRQA
jgi:hypothetical protein